MPTQTITPPATRKIGEDMVHAAFPHSFNFRVELPFSDALDFIRQIGPHNDFDPETVIEALEHVDRAIPRTQYPTDHPNNGQRNYRLSVGREGSPVIYLERSEYAFLRHAVAPLSDAAIKRICQEMELCGHADEATYEVHEFSGGSRTVEFRFWWD